MLMSLVIEQIIDNHYVKIFTFINLYFFQEVIYVAMVTILKNNLPDNLDLLN
jgi:hypothetical protein